ncbi:MAG: helix-turn-helix domain-containing protein [Tropicimonas sp.]|uniref:helix-turn-helix domain-containing protein n=1 Tax=Tropicimonas sp. TaxID=2067044 RepID=UPI003A8B3431
MVELVRSPKQLGVALRRFRRAQALTQTEMAERAGVRQATVSQVETGLETVKLSTVMGMLRALDLEIVVQPRTKGSHSDIEDIF